MFSSARSKSVEINLTLENTAVRRYEDGEWSTPPRRELRAFVDEERLAEAR
jgi:hypothetical protein